MNLSAVILTKNEEKNIERCLKSLTFCDEIIIVDDYSEDKTLEKCQMFVFGGRSNVKCQMFKRKLNGNFAEQRNFGLGKARGDWVLFIDSDEKVSKKLAEEIVEVTNNLRLYSGFFLKRDDFIWGKRLNFGECGSIKILRLAKRGDGKFERCVHEVWKIDGKIGILKNHLNHFPHPTLSEFIYDINKMSDLHALANKEDGKKATLAKIVFWPQAHFLKNYIVKRGLRDGMAGFVFALIMSFHSYLAWSKLWLLQKGSQK